MSVSHNPEHGRAQCARTPDPCNKVAAELKEVVDLVVGGKETLCLPRRLEALHLSFSSSRRLVGILGSVIQALVLAVLDAGRDLLLRSAIAGQLVGDQDAQRPALPLQQLAQEPFGGSFVSPALHQDVEHKAVLVALVDCAPHPVLLAGNFDGTLVEVPFVSGAGQSAPDSVSEVLAELQGPLPHRLVADDDAAYRQHLLDYA